MTNFTLFQHIKQGKATVMAYLSHDGQFKSKPTLFFSTIKDALVHKQRVGLYDLMIAGNKGGLYDQLGRKVRMK